LVEAGWLKPRQIAELVPSKISTIVLGGTAALHAYRVWGAVLFAVKTAHTLKISEPQIVTVTGKEFYDFAHAPADHSNRRHSPKDTLCGKFERLTNNISDDQQYPPTQRVRTMR